MRTQKSVVNMAVGLLGQLLNLILAIASRSILARFMPSEYLGVNGLFSNVLTVLSLADLGIGTAIMYALYAPVAREDRREIQRLMNLYRKLYRYVAAAVAALGLALLPFLNLLIRTERPVDHIVLIYLMYLSQSVASYFFVYKTALIEAHQKQYICSIYTNVFTLLRYAGQIVVLIATRNFFLYLAVQILCGLLPNLFASRRAERMYPYLKEDKTSYPEQEERREIFRNVKALFIHKAAGMMVYSVDSILISALVSLGATGVYSNYKLISSNVGGIIDRLFEGISASVGNLIATEPDGERRYHIFSTLNFGAFLLYSYGAVAMLLLFEPFILLYFGPSYLLPRRTALLLLAQFYMTGMRTVTQKFRNAQGIFWYDRYKALVEVFVNFTLSILLAARFGLDGILGATVIDLVLIPFWVDPVVLICYGWKEHHRKYLAGYFTRYFRWTAGMVLAGYVTQQLCGRMEVPNLAGFVAKGLACTAVYGGLMLALFGWTRECRELFAYARQVLKHVKLTRGRTD